MTKIPTPSSDAATSRPPTAYERNQQFNPLVAFLHGIRYKRLLSVFTRLAEKYPDRALKVVDIGCAHAKSFEILNDRFDIAYTGIELDGTFAEIARERHGAKSNFRIINDSVANHYVELSGADVILALETLEHIPEHVVVRLIEQIAAARPKVFFCSVPNEVGPIVLIKNLGSLLTGYMRHTEYRWRETFHASLFNLDKVEAHGTGHKGFDWRWLAQTIRHNMKISRIHASPFDWLPKTLSFSIIFVCFARD